MAKTDPAHAKRALKIDRRKRRVMSRTKPESTQVKRLTVDLDEPLHRAIKKNAAEEGVTMARMLRALLTEHYRLAKKIR